MLTALIALIALATAQPQAAQNAAPAPMDYADAKRQADANESSVAGIAHASMLAAQKTLLDTGVAECASHGLREDFSPFTVVMQLSAEGRVQQTWRQGDSPLAICLQRFVRDKLVFVPPKAPFHTALEISFTK